MSHGVIYESWSHIWVMESYMSHGFTESSHMPVMGICVMSPIHTPIGTMTLCHHVIKLYVMSLSHMPMTLCHVSLYTPPTIVGLWLYDSICMYAGMSDFLGNSLRISGILKKLA